MTEAMLRAVCAGLCERGISFSKLEMVVAGWERASATYGASFKGELIVSFSCFLCETAFVRP